MSGESFTYEPPMDLTAVPFVTTDWSTLEPVVHPGITGSALWRTCHFGTTRVRMVEYTRATWPIIGAGVGMCCCVWKASCTLSWRTAATSP